MKVRDLATKVRTLKKSGEKKPFVCVDLPKFLPPSCMKHVALTATGETKEEKQGHGSAQSNKGKGLRLPMELWLVAWDRMALAGEMVEHQLTFAQAMRHKEVVLDVAFAAVTSGRSSLVGVLYDELARRVLSFNHCGWE